MISLRLPKDMENKINALARIEGRSRSEIVKQSIAEYIEHHQAQLTAYELGKDLFGRHGSGRGDLAERRKEYLTQKLRSKHGKK